MTIKKTLIELMYDDAVVLEAEKLFESDAVQHVVQVDKTLYSATVIEDQNYDVEIFAPFTKKQKLQCVCNAFKQHKICRHTVALLFLIRDQINFKKENQRLSKIQPNKKSTSLGIQQIIDAITVADLKNFVKAYAQSDKKFSTQLKVAFARKIDIEDNLDKYKVILNSLVRPHASAKPNASVSDLKALLSVLEDFLDQINDCIALKQYREAYSIFHVSFAKLAYIRHYYSSHIGLSDNLDFKYHLVIPDFLNEKLPPELKNELILFLKEMMTRSYYHFSDIRHNILYQLYEYIKPQERRESLESIESLIPSRPPKEQSVLWALYIKYKGKVDTQVLALLSSFSHLFIEISDHLIHHDGATLALVLLEFLYKKNKKDKAIIQRLVYVYVKTQNVKNLVEIAKAGYQLTGDFKFLDVLESSLETDYFHREMVKFGEELISSKVQPDLVIRLFKREKNWAGLLLYLDALNNLELLQQNDVLLYQHEKRALIELYLYIIKNYLNDHLGDSTFEYLKSVKQHFIQARLLDLITPIAQMLKENYAHRPKLFETFNSI